MKEINLSKGLLKRDLFKPSDFLKLNSIDNTTNIPDTKGIKDVKASRLSNNIFIENSFIESGIKLKKEK